MLLTGTFLRALDEKQRLAIPKRLRDALGFPQKCVMYLAPGTDGSLAIYTEQAFARLAEHLDRGSPTGADVRAFSRLFFAQSQRADLDRQGRLRIPPEMVELAELSKEVVLIGVRDHLELWDKDRWEQYLDDKRTHYDEIAENAFQQGAEASRNTERKTQQAEQSETVAHPGQPR